MSKVDDVTLAPSILAADVARWANRVAGSSIFGDRDGVTAAMGRLRTVIDRPKEEPEPAEQPAS